MKASLVLFVLVLAIYSSYAYEKFVYHNGDEILRQLQKMDGKTYLLFFFKNPGTNRDLRTTNDYFKDRIRAEVLEPKDAPATPYVYAEVDATDLYGNGYLVDRLKVSRDGLNEWPTIVLMKDGKGNVIRGPTAIHSVKESLKALAAPPQNS